MAAATTVAAMAYAPRTVRALGLPGQVGRSPAVLVIQAASEASMVIVLVAARRAVAFSGKAWT